MERGRVLWVRRVRKKREIALLKRGRISRGIQALMDSIDRKLLIAIICQALKK